MAGPPESARKYQDAFGDEESLEKYRNRLSIQQEAISKIALSLQLKVDQQCLKTQSDIPSLEEAKLTELNNMKIQSMFDLVHSQSDNTIQYRNSAPTNTTGETFHSKASFSYATSDFGTKSETKRSSWMPSVFRKKTDHIFPRETTKLHNKSSSNFSNLVTLQSISADVLRMDNKKTSKGNNPCWVAKFSPDGRFLAVGGADCVLRVFTVNESESYSSLELARGNINLLQPDHRRYSKHAFDIIDLDWSADSKRILTASLDSKAILWDIDQEEPLKVFQHCDIVSCVSFHPLAKDVCVTGCFDKMIRVWDMTDGKVVDWFQANDMITAMCFHPESTHLVVGYFKGFVKIYRADEGKLKFEMEIECKNKYKFGKLNKHGKKITGIQFVDENQFLVATNDSRIRLIDFKSYEILAKYKGCTNQKYQIRPNYCNQTEMLISGSEDGRAYIWNKTKKTTFESPTKNSTPLSNEKNDSYETLKPFEKSKTTVAMFLPFGVTKKIQSKLFDCWKNLCLDSLMLFVSYDYEFKIVGNFLPLDL